MFLFDDVIMSFEDVAPIVEIHSLPYLQISCYYLTRIVVPVMATSATYPIDQNGQYASQKISSGRWYTAYSSGS